jgi:hypothetical protein
MITHAKEIYRKRPIGRNRAAVYSDCHPLPSPETILLLRAILAMQVARNDREVLYLKSEIKGAVQKIYAELDREKAISAMQSSG